MIDLKSVQEPPHYPFSLLKAQKAEGKCHTNFVAEVFRLLWSVWKHFRNKTVRTALLGACIAFLLSGCMGDKARFCSPQEDYSPQGSGFFRDDNGILHKKVFVYTEYEPADGYFCFKEVPEIDVASWSHLFNMYWRDAENVFHIQYSIEGETITKLAGANPDGFMPADSSGFSARDENQVWVGGRELKGVNPGEMVCVEDYFWDKKMVYYITDRVEGADAESFQVLGDGYARDAFRTYLNGNPVIKGAPALAEIFH